MEERVTVKDGFISSPDFITLKTALDLKNRDHHMNEQLEKTLNNRNVDKALNEALGNMRSSLDNPLDKVVCRRGPIERAGGQLQQF
ncbi:MAG: hypothetical protein ACOYNL_00755 [Rickettsiales bacterium]